MGNDDKGFRFFNGMDVKPNGKHMGEVPAWSLDGKMRLLDDRIDSDAEALKNPILATPEKAQRLAELKARKQQILDSKPKLSASERDTLSKAYKEAAEGLREVMPTYDQMNKGLADPNEENRRDYDSKCCKLRPEMAAAMGVNAPDGKVTRYELAKFYKLAGKLLGENSSVERLRR